MASIRKNKKVQCKDCVFYIHRGRMPFCCATAKAVSGPVFNIIDVEGVVSPLKRNRRNNCKYHKTLFSSIGHLPSIVKKRSLTEMFLPSLEGEYTPDIELAALRHKPKVIEPEKEITLPVEISNPKPVVSHEEQLTNDEEDRQLGLDFEEANKKQRYINEELFEQITGPAESELPPIPPPPRRRREHPDNISIQ